MAVERFIRGKHDDAKHVGKYHNVKAEQAADYHLQHWEEELPDVASKDGGRSVKPLAVRFGLERYQESGQETGIIYDANSASGRPSDSESEN